MPLSSLVVIATALIVGGFLLFYKPLADSSAWRATITPLASIMGSGFLVCAPLLYANVGNYAVWAMSGLLVLAYGVGSVIRFNIRYGEPVFAEHSTAGKISQDQHPLHVGHCNGAQRVGPAGPAGVLEKASHVVLAGGLLHLRVLLSATPGRVRAEVPLPGRRVLRQDPGHRDPGGHRRGGHGARPQGHRAGGARGWWA